MKRTARKPGCAERADGGGFGDRRRMENHGAPREAPVHYSSGYLGKRIVELRVPNAEYYDVGARCIGRNVPRRRRDTRGTLAMQSDDLDP